MDGTLEQILGDEILVQAYRNQRFYSGRKERHEINAYADYVASKNQAIVVDNYDVSKNHIMVTGPSTVFFHCKRRTSDKITTIDSVKSAIKTVKSLKSDNVTFKGLNSKASKEFLAKYSSPIERQRLNDSYEEYNQKFDCLVDSVQVLFEVRGLKVGYASDIYYKAVTALKFECDALLRNMSVLDNYMNKLVRAIDVLKNPVFNRQRVLHVGI